MEEQEMEVITVDNVQRYMEKLDNLSDGKFMEWANNPITKAITKELKEFNEFNKEDGRSILIRINCEKDANNDNEVFVNLLVRTGNYED